MLAPVLIETTSPTLLSESEYLRTHYEDPEPDYVEGELIERPMPNFFHGIIQAGLVERTAGLKRKYPITTACEVRIQVAPRKYRVVDYLLFYPERPSRNIPEFTPYVVAEIVSPDDTHAEIMKKVREYHAMGVKHIWLIDPEARDLSVYDGHSISSVEALELPEFEFRITIDDLLDAR